ncbi:hypothetical protein SESBI_19505 [Sesbania bispinosa]|nr:hypothetical protein SESBI_19505 [Sesbania bispinosa]
MSQGEGRRSDEGELEDDIQMELDLEDTKKHEGSNIYTRVKGQPRKRVVSARVRSLWMTYSRKRKKQDL